MHQDFFATKTLALDSVHSMASFEFGDLENKLNGLNDRYIILDHHIRDLQQSAADLQNWCSGQEIRAADTLPRLLNAIRKLDKKVGPWHAR
jgi:hypothetical protein